MALVPSPSVVSKTIWARETCLCGLLRSRTIASNRERSAGPTAMDIPFAHRAASHKTTSRESAIGSLWAAASNWS